MVARYQSPPTWPAPPPGWVPPPGWTPDPSWGPPPPGWQFWAEEQAQKPNRGAFGWCLLSAAVWWLVWVVLLSALSGTFNPEAAGGILASCLLGGLFAALAVRWINLRIPGWAYPLLVLPFIFVLRLASVAGGS